MALNRTEIAWIYWTGLALVVAIGGALFLARGGLQGPGCSSRSVQATVRDLAQKNAGLGRSTFDLDEIAETGTDPQAGTITCHATLWAEYKDLPFMSTQITYTIERQADGKIIVRVQGISDWQRPAMPQP